MKILVSIKWVFQKLDLEFWLFLIRPNINNISKAAVIHTTAAASVPVEANIFKMIHIIDINETYNII